ncbi:MAG: hypothetical protein KGL64_12280, partial [Acidobacteriota bacterium]|nr:hypothetical protein [Acidobacteriota bacterium]
MRSQKGPSVREGRVALPRKATYAPLALLAALAVMVGCKPAGPNYNRPAYQAPAVYKESGAKAVVPPPNPPGGSWQPASP